MKYNSSNYGQMKSALGIENTLGFRPTVTKTVDPDTGIETTADSGFFKAIIWDDTQKIVVSTTLETIVALRKTKDSTKIVFKQTLETSEKTQTEYNDVFFFVDKTEEF